MKIRVFDSDGVYRGGLFKTKSLNAINCRMWHAPPHPNYRESLIDIAGKNNPCDDSSWYRLQLAAVPDLSGPPDGSDDFDANSRAIRISPGEAADWFDRHGFPRPPDLTELLGQIGTPSHADRSANGQPAPGTAARATSTGTAGTPAPVAGGMTGGAAAALAPLPDGARAVWEALAGKVLSAKQLAQQLDSNEHAVRKQITALNRLGRAVQNRRGAGYFRPDAPPPA